jgi:hypothetical protein
MKDCAKKRIKSKSTIQFLNVLLAFLVKVHKPAQTTNNKTSLIQSGKLPFTNHHHIHFVPSTLALVLRPSNHRNMATSSKVRNDSVLPQRTRVRVQREIINLLKNAPEGTKLIVDPETGLPPSLTEIVVSYLLYQE